MELILDNYKVKWVDLGEGCDGDYDPSDPDDVCLLRFDISELATTDTGEEWVEVPNGSYCTRMPTSTSHRTLLRALVEIALEVVNTQGGKRAMERLSWIRPEEVA